MDALNDFWQETGHVMSGRENDRSGLQTLEKTQDAYSGASGRLADTCSPAGGKPVHLITPIIGVQLNCLIPYRLLLLGGAYLIYAA